MRKHVLCPKCGTEIRTYRNPLPTADVIIHNGNGVVLIRRKNPPIGWALPGGFIDYGETAEHAAVREAKEETSLDIAELKLFGVYSDPSRDPRHHTITVVFTAVAQGTPRAADDAEEIGVFQENDIPSPLVFDHAAILADYFGRLDG